MEETVEKKRGKIPFNQLPKNQQTYRSVALCLAAAVFLCLVTAGIVYAIVGDPDLRILPSFGVALLAVIPFILELIFKVRFSSFFLIFIYIFMFFSGFLGCSLNWYNVFWSYDIIIHGIFGYVGSVMGLFILVKSFNHDKMNLLGAVVCIFAVSMALGAIWEIIEFAADNLMGANGQGFPMTGIKPDGSVIADIRDVRDTMEDIIANFIGAIVFAAHYILHKVTKKNLVIGSMLKDFAN